MLFNPVRRESGGGGRPSIGTEITLGAPIYIGESGKAGEYMYLRVGCGNESWRAGDLSEGRGLRFLARWFACPTHPAYIHTLTKELGPFGLLGETCFCGRMADHS